MNGFDSEHKGDRESALRLIQTLLKDRTLVTLELQQQMVDERKDLADTDAGKEVRAEIIKERMRAERMIAEIQEEHKEALQAQDIRSAEALAEVREDYTRKIARLDTAFERIKISTEKLIEEKYEKMLKRSMRKC
jgi:DNA-binding PadR family transcriptional regulator